MNFCYQNLYENYFFYIEKKLIKTDLNCTILCQNFILLKLKFFTHIFSFSITRDLIIIFLSFHFRLISSKLDMHFEARTRSVFMLRTTHQSRDIVSKIPYSQIDTSYFIHGCYVRKGDD